MARPAGGYRLKDGTKVPGASTIAQIAKDSGGLIHWSWQLGMEGKDYREVRDAAADAGTMMHEAAEHWKRGTPYEWAGPPDVVARARRGYAAFLEWTRQTRLKIEETEVSLVSEKYRFGGTFDAMLIGEQRVMADYKSASSVYPEHLLQVVAYAKLWEEHHPDQLIDGGYYILRFTGYGDFAASWYGELEDAWQAFLHNRALYDLKAALKKRCG
jgi:PD-(D/E)XK nuclease superfamily